MTNRDKLLTFSALALLLTAGYPAMAQDDSSAGNGAPGVTHDGPPPMDGPPDGEPPKDGPPGDGPSGDGPMGGKGGRGAEMFMKADTNHDGLLSKEEMLNAHKERLDEMFNKADTNHDNELSPEEMKKGREMMRAKFKERMQEMRGQNGGQGGMGDGSFRERMMERRNGQGGGDSGSTTSPDAPSK